MKAFSLTHQSIYIPTYIPTQHDSSSYHHRSGSSLPPNTTTTTAIAGAAAPFPTAAAAVTGPATVTHSNSNLNNLNLPPAVTGLVLPQSLRHISGGLVLINQVGR